MRDDPVPDEDVTLLLSLADESDHDAVEAAIEATVTDVGGRVTDRLAFETIAVEIPQPAIPALCELDGIAAAETGDTIGITPGDAGEDLDSTETDDSS